MHGLQYAFGSLKRPTELLIKKKKLIEEFHIQDCITCFVNCLKQVCINIGGGHFLYVDFKKKLSAETRPRFSSD